MGHPRFAARTEGPFPGNGIEGGPYLAVFREMWETQTSAYDSWIMTKRWLTFVAFSFLMSVGFAKDKNKTTLPPFVLHAQTVAVMVDPNTQFSVNDPTPTLMAQKDVEAALLKWGRFRPVSDVQSADLIVVVRKGNGRMMDDMSPDSRQNNGGSMGPNDRGSMGQHGPQSNLPSEGIGQQGPGSTSGFGYTSDFFAVFKAGDNPRTAIPVWKYPGQDGLNPAGVPAVAAFRKAIDAADKAAAEKP
jgi:hypothetical protein